jgi:16S rRNA (cytidine1402-2'-O)-methyltransferase
VFFEAPHRIEATLGEIQRAVGDCRVSIGRELTKAHEELVVGPISTLLPLLKRPKGEYTVVLEPLEPTPSNSINRPNLDILAGGGDPLDSNKIWHIA